MAKPPTKHDVIKKYLYGDLERFLKRYYRYSRFELIYSVTLSQYEKEVKGIRMEILNMFKGEFPGALIQTINVHRVMVKYYDFEIDIEDIKLSHRISQVLSTSISDYKKQRYYYRINNLMLQPHRCKPKQALKELLARGFIHVNDFEKYDKRMAHITSNANVPVKYGRLYFPMNFTWDAWSKAHVINRGYKWWHFVDVYTIIGEIGISGYTRVLTPQSK